MTSFWVILPLVESNKDCSDLVSTPLKDLIEGDLIRLKELCIKAYFRTV